jgi:serine/threonine protein kinase
MRGEFALKTLEFSGGPPNDTDQKVLDAWKMDLMAYTHVCPLGRGSFGDVFLGEDPVTKKRVAIKVFSLLVAHRTNVQQNFDREFLQLINCNHPCVHSIIGWCQPNKDEVRLATELMDNGSVADVIAKNPTPPEWDDTAKARALVGTAMGMSYIHQRTLVHRDLKPANVFIDKDWNPRVGDLGSCRYTDLLMTVGVGTPIYRAPELNADETYDESVDVFSFGMMSWEIITGKSLTTSVFARFKTAFAVSKAIVDGLRPPLDDVDPEIGAVLARCWSPDSNKRPPFDNILHWFKSINYKIRPGVNGAQVAAYVADVERMERQFCK